MSKLDPNSFLYLNRDNRWADFALSGLVLGGDGAIRLTTLPRLEGQIPEVVLDTTDAEDGGAIAVGDDGTTWFTDSGRHRIIRIDPCDGKQALIQCLGIESSASGQCGQIGGIAFNPIRKVLLVSDIDENRVRVFDPVSLQLLGLWTGDGIQPFDKPGAIAVGPDGGAYVVDPGNQRVVKFDHSGNPIPRFWSTVQSELQTHQRSLQHPSEIAIAGQKRDALVYVLDQDSGSIIVFDGDGHYVLTIELHSESPVGLAVDNEGIFVGDAARKRLLKVDRDGTFVGEAQDFQGVVRALALDGHGGLLVNTGGDPAILRLDIAGAHVKRGWMSGGPFHNPSPRREQWNRLKAAFEPLPEGAHFELLIYASNIDDPPIGAASSEPPWEGNAIELSDSIKQQVANREPLTRWVRLPLDVAEGLFLGSRLETIWIGVELSGEGFATAALSQIRLDFDHETYIQHLPGIYREDRESELFLTRLLALFESSFVEVEAKIRSLPELFDPFAVRPEFLQWLAGWLALTELDGEWSDKRKREVIAKAFELYAKRGTVEGLRESLRFFAGIDGHIEEPLLQAGWWALPEDEDSSLESRQTSLLGFSTTLVAAEPQGAVVGTTATLDRSHLITDDEFGAPLFDDLAHRFSLHLYRGALFSQGTLEMVRAIVEREKPAHTDYHLCVIEPNLRVGFQSRIGIDTIVAGAIQPTHLEEPITVAGGLVLAGEPAGRIGQRSSVGQSTRLGLRQFEDEVS
jgi:phage tail-like protein